MNFRLLPELENIWNLLSTSTGEKFQYPDTGVQVCSIPLMSHDKKIYSFSTLLSQKVLIKWITRCSRCFSQHIINASKDMDLSCDLVKVKWAWVASY